MARQKKKQPVRKKATSKRKPARKKRKTATPRRWKWFRWLLLASLVSGVIYTAYLDYIIRDRFEGNRWEIPARVYARPLELYVGRQLDKAALLTELKALRYRKVANPELSGTYQQLGDQLVIMTRPFRYWDGSEVSQRIRIGFSENTITLLEHAVSRKALDVVRLDPIRIASIYPRHNEDRILVQLKQVPSFLINGLIKVEDRKFRQHHGIDFTAILRAVYSNIRAGRTVQGGSTLTQQLVKNYFLTNKRSLTRKINEALMSLLVEWHYEKNDILEAYLNEVYLGQDGKRSINGFGLASQFYFGTTLEHLKPHQMALLVGLVKGPSYYDPRRHANRALKRRNLVLKVMAERGQLSSKLSAQYQKMPLSVIPARGSRITRYPAFLDLVKRQLRRDYREQDLSSAGLQIFTTLNPVVQKKAEQALSQQLGIIEKSRKLPTNRLQGAVVVTDTNSAEVLAIVGDRRPSYAGFNRALDAIRAIGSLIKPAVYLAALKDPGYSLASLIDDDPLQIEQPDGIWEPQNYDKQWHGQVPVIMAFANSYNIATVRLGMQVGLEKVAQVLKSIGVRRPVKQYPSMLLGTLAMSPLEVAQMYQTFAGNGFYSPLRSIRAVLDAKGEPLNRYPLSVKQAIPAQENLIINYAMHIVTRVGTARGLVSLLPEDMKVAGKTGTTDDLRDSWFAGFTNEYVAVVWVGHDDDKPTTLTGSSGALPVWARFVRGIKAHSLQLNPVEGIEMAWIDMLSGKKTARGCRNAIELPFKKGTVPEQSQACEGGVIDWLNRVLR